MVTRNGRRAVRLVVGLTVCLIAAAVSAQTPNYGVTVVSEKKMDFTTLKTYVWTNGQPAALPSADKQLVAAIEKELAGVGLKKLTTGKADVDVAYGALRRTDVDTNSKPDATGAMKRYEVGSVYVVMFEPGTRNPILRLRLDKPLEMDPAKAEATVNAAVAELFTKYPTRRPKK